LESLVAVASSEGVSNDSTSYAVLEGGEGFACGNNNYGKRGSGDLLGNTAEFRQIAMPRAEKLEIVSAGMYHAVAVGQGQLYSWGSNEMGKLGHSDDKQQVREPTRVEFPRRERVVNAWAAKGSTTCKTESVRIYTWGNNGDGQLGRAAGGRRAWRGYSINLSRARLPSPCNTP
jgi:hypothetical protein